MVSVKRASLAVGLLLTLVSCSNYQATELPFVDSFDRADTTLGLGEGWDMRGPYVDAFPLPPATDGFIKGGKYTYSGDSVVYAVRRMDGTVHRMGAQGQWRQTGEGSDTTVAMAITSNDLLVSDMVHFAASRGNWELTVRRAGGAFEPVAKGRFVPVLDLGVQYRFQLQATDETVTVTVPGTEVTKKVSTAGLLGDRVFWEEYPNGTPVGTVFDVNAVWASE